MTSISESFLYFVGWGLFYGGSLGLLCGTLILPFIGSIPSLICGIGIGFTLGVVTGIIAEAKLATIKITSEEDFIIYRRRLTLLNGVVSAIGALLLVYLSFETIFYHVDERDPLLFVVLLFALLWGGLAAAHTTSRGVDLYTKGGYKYGLPQVTMEYYELKWQFPQHLLIGVASGAIGFFHRNTIMSGVSPVEAVLVFIFGFIVGVLASLVVGFVVGIANATLVRFLNRLVFYEYFPHLSKVTYRRVLFGLVAFVSPVFFTPLLIMSDVWYFSLFIALASATSAAKYADQHWGVQKKQQPSAPVDEWDDSPFEDEYAASVGKAQ
jgi:hypothetical protein